MFEINVEALEIVVAPMTFWEWQREHGYCITTDSYGVGINCA